MAYGDLSRQIDVDASGEISDLKNTVNGMVVGLRSVISALLPPSQILFAPSILTAEVTRVSLEVGSQGKLGGRAHVPGAEGVWYELVMNVNKMCSTLTDQV